MKWGSQRIIAKVANISEPSVSQYINGGRRPTWTKAKILANITKTNPALWLDGTPDEIKAALKNKNIKTNPTEEDDSVE